jgi:hypothetical protein
VEDRIQRLRRYRLEETLRRQRAELLQKIMAGQLSRDDPTWQVWQETLRTLKLPTR